MYKVIKIGAKDVPMLANGATPYRYKQIFRADYFKQVTEDNSPATSIDVFTKMGFVMAMQAEKKDMRKVSEDMFFEWLEQFESMDISNACGEIAVLIAGNEGTNADPKKQAAD